MFLGQVQILGIAIGVGGPGHMQAAEEVVWACASRCQGLSFLACGEGLWSRIGVHRELKG